jgi:polyisoprenoid-binding protein YceI
VSRLEVRPAGAEGQNDKNSPHIRGEHDVMSTAAAPATTTWNLDATHTGAEFAVRHLMISTVKGRFADVKGTLVTPGDDLTKGTADIAIAVSSIDTREAQRDAHLRSADFFDAENHPTITFRSRRVQPGGDGGFTLVGDLTIRGTTREVALEVTPEGRAKDPWGGERVGFSATTTIKRSDYGLTWNQALETGGVLVGDDIRISIDAQFVKQ